MNKISKTISLALCVCITCLSLFVSVSATSNPILFANDCVCQSEDIVEIPLLIQSNPGFMGIGLEISYNQNCFTPVRVENGQILDVGMTNDSIMSSMPGSFNIFWAGTENIEEDGELFVLVFSVSSNVSRNETIHISLLQDDTFNENYNDVVIESRDIAVSITGTSSHSTEDVSLSVLTNGETIDVLGSTASIGVAIDSEVEIRYDSAVLSVLNVTGNGAVVSNVSSNTNSVSFHLRTESSSNKNLFTINFSRLTDVETQLVFSGVVSALNDTTPLRIISTSYTLNKSEITIYTDDHLSGKHEVDLDIPIYISNNSGIMGYKLIFQYDQDSIQPFAIVPTTLFNGALENSLGVNSGEFSVVWCGTENQTNNGLLFYIRCHVFTEETESIPFVISYSAIDTFDESLTSLMVSCLSSTIDLNQAVTGVVGDADGDGHVNAMDVHKIMRYLSGYNDEGFYPELADFTGDGKINARDVLLLMFAIVNGEI